MVFIPKIRLYITDDGKWKFVSFEKIYLLTCKLGFIFQIIPRGNKYRKWFTFISSFEFVNFLVRCLIIESAADPITRISRDNVYLVRHDSWLYENAYKKQYISKFSLNTYTKKYIQIPEATATFRDSFFHFIGRWHIESERDWAVSDTQSSSFHTMRHIFCNTFSSLLSSQREMLLLFFSSEIIVQFSLFL